MNKIIKSPVKVADEHYLISFEHSGEPVSPGQFVNIKVSELQSDPLLRRPFSIFDAHQNKIEIIFRTVGKGTQLLQQTKAEELDILGPLGHGWDLISEGTALLIGGGVGNAPLYYLAKTLKRLNVKVIMIYGARSENLIYCQDKFASVCDEFYLTTDDGTAGEKGFVTDVEKRLLKEKKIDKIYCCGPTIMMKKVFNIAAEQKTAIDVSLENYFGCGIGLCAGCAVQTTKGTLKACKDGPVFDGYLLKWDTL